MLRAHSTSPLPGTPPHRVGHPPALGPQGTLGLATQQSPEQPNAAHPSWVSTLQSRGSGSLCDGRLGFTHAAEHHCITVALPALQGHCFRLTRPFAFLLLLLPCSPQGLPCCTVHWSHIQCWGPRVGPFPGTVCLNATTTKICLLSPCGSAAAHRAQHPVCRTCDPNQHPPPREAGTPMGPGLGAQCIGHLCVLASLIG